MHSFLRSALVLATLFRCAAAFAATQSSSIVITPDDKTVWSVNTDSSSVSVFNVEADALVKIKEIKVGNDPKYLVLDPARSMVFVSTTRGQTVVQIDVVRLRVLRPAKLPGQPEAMVLSPGGATLYVANTAANTIQRLDTTTNPPTLTGTLDLSAFGSYPAAMAMTDDGDADDDDETIYVTVFFGQVIPGTPIDRREGFDDGKEGRVVVISTATFTATDVIELAPLADTGFNSNGKFAPATGGVPAVAPTNPPEFTTPTGAFPNQLRWIVLHPTNGKGYVLSTGASPNGPLRFDSNTQPLISVFDTVTGVEVTSAQTAATTHTKAPLNFNLGVREVDVAKKQLFFANPWAMAVKADGSAGFATVQSSNVVVRVEFDANGIPTIGAPLTSGPGAIVQADLEEPGAGFISGKAPRGIVLNSAGTRAYVHNHISRSITVLDISDPITITVVGTALATKVPKATSKDRLALLGQELFNASRGPIKPNPKFSGRFAMSNNGWGSCFNCHPDGLSDNVTWLFPDGPRQTPALDGTSSKGGPGGFTQRLLQWSATRSEIQDFEKNTEAVSGGFGLIGNYGATDDVQDHGATRTSKSDATLIGGTGSAAVENLDTATGAVSTANPVAGGAPFPQLPADRRDFATVTLPDGRVIIIGGRSGGGAGTLIPLVDAVLIFDPRKNTLTRKTSRGFTPRHSLGGAAVRTDKGTRVYVIGGYASTDPNALPLATVEEYDPATNKWRPVAPLPAAVAQFGTSVAGGTNMANLRELIHVVGGNTASEMNPSLVNAFLVQRFQADPRGTGTWNGFNPAGLTPRRNHGVITVQRGNQQRIFVVGGQDAAGTILASVQEYFPDNMIIVTTVNTPLPSPRARFGIATVPSFNQLFVIGGVDAAGVEQDTIFDCDYSLNDTTPGALGSPSGVWRTVGMLSSPRSAFGVANPIPVGELFPANNAGRDRLLDAVAFWIHQKVVSVRGVGDPKSPAVKHGRQLFGTHCATCHGGKRWTISRADYPGPPLPEQVTGIQITATKRLAATLFDIGTYDASDANEIRGLAPDMRGTSASLGALGFNIPSLLGVRATAPYGHQGRAQTLAEVFAPRANDGLGHPDFGLSAQDINDVVEFMKRIDANEKAFPE